MLHTGGCCTSPPGREASANFYCLWCFDVRYVDVIHVLLQRMNPTYLEGVNGRNIYLAFEMKVMIILGNVLLRNNVDFPGSTSTQGISN